MGMQAALDRRSDARRRAAAEGTSSGWIRLRLMRSNGGCAPKTAQACGQKRGWRPRGAAGQAKIRLDDGLVLEGQRYAGEVLLARILIANVHFPSHIGERGLHAPYFYGHAGLNAADAHPILQAHRPAGCL